MAGTDFVDFVDNLDGPVLRWFQEAFPGGPTPAQRLAWPVISS
jgi:hypothetical protein